MLACMKWLITALSILLGAAISLCFSYKEKLHEANQYIQFLQGGFPK